MPFPDREQVRGDRNAPGVLTSVCVCARAYVCMCVVCVCVSRLGRGLWTLALPKRPSWPHDLSSPHSPALPALCPSLSVDSKGGGKDAFCTGEIQIQGKWQFLFLPEHPIVSCEMWTICFPSMETCCLLEIHPTPSPWFSPVAMGDENLRRAQQPGNCPASLSPFPVCTWPLACLFSIPRGFASARRNALPRRNVLRGGR